MRISIRSAFLLLAAGLLCTAAMSSCADSGSDSGGDDALTNGGKPYADGAVLVCGAISSNGYEARQARSANAAMAAYTVVPSADAAADYTIEGTKSGEAAPSATGEFTRSGSNINYTIMLTQGTWTITAKGWDKSHTAAGAKVVCQGNAANIAVPAPAGGSLTGKDITMALANSGGAGAVSLEITACNTIETAKVTYTPSIAGAPNTLTFSDGKATINLTDVPSGTYAIKIEFLDANRMPRYMLNDTLNVFNNMTTDEWMADSGEYVSGGKCNITQILVNKFNRTTYYVGQAGAAGNDTTGTGSYFAPFASMNKAVSMINAQNDGSSQYKIYVCGEVAGNNAKTVLDSTTVTHALDLTIEGLNGDGTADALNVNGANNAIEIDSALAALTVKNITVKGAASAKHGIYVGKGNHVALKGVVIVGAWDAGTSTASGNDVYLQKDASNSANNAYIQLNSALSGISCVNVMPESTSNGTVLIKGTGITAATLSPFHLNAAVYGSIAPASSGTTGVLQVPQSGGEIKLDLPSDYTVSVPAIVLTRGAPYTVSLTVTNSKGGAARATVTQLILKCGAIEVRRVSSDTITADLRWPTSEQDGPYMMTIIADVAGANGTVYKWSGTVNVTVQ